MLHATSAFSCRVLALGHTNCTNRHPYECFRGLRPCMPTRTINPYPTCQICTSRLRTSPTLVRAVSADCPWHPCAHPVVAPFRIRLK